MKFSNLFAVSTLATLAVATPLQARQGDCNTGPIQCCNSVTKASDPVTSVLLGLLGIVLQDVNVLVGLTCSPITVIGGGN
ncbi:hypothetical protein V5O48_019011, partial [Marasmius crinis-equi]